MLRTAIARAPRRYFTTARIMRADGATGATRAGGEKAGDAFNKREKAQEELWIREEEKKKLEQLRDKLQEQKKHIETLTGNIDDLIRKAKN